MEEVLKGLKELKGPKGKPLTKKKLFDFLADIDLEELCGKKPFSTEVLEVKKPEIKCAACSKTFTVDNSLKRHYKRSPACVKWIEKEEKAKDVNLEKGIHLIIIDLLEKAVGCPDNRLKCRWCETTFINTGNTNKHLNTSKVCNLMAYQEFKRLLDNL
jgi:hypothetical protein